MSGICEYVRSGIAPLRSGIVDLAALDEVICEATWLKLWALTCAQTEIQVLLRFF